MRMPAGPFVVRLNEDAQKQFRGLDNAVRDRIKKRLEKLKINHDVRTLKEWPEVWIAGIGDYRALYLIDEQTKNKTVFFIGDHKGYERRYEKMFGEK